MNNLSNSILLPIHQMVTMNDFGRPAGAAAEEMMPQCDRIFQFYNSYIEKSISIAGIVFNAISLMIFLNDKIYTNLNKNKHFMYKYLALKSLCDSLFLSQNLTNYLIESDSHFLSSKLNTIYIIKIFNAVFTYYFCFMCQLISMLCDIAATFDRYLLIKSKHHHKSSLNVKTKNKRIHYIYIILVSISFSSVFYIYKLFQFQIIQLDQTNPSHLSHHHKSNIYQLNVTEFGHTFVSQLFDFTNSLIRDGICVIVLFTLNLIILIRLKKFVSNKKKLNNINRANQRNQSVRSKRSLERNSIINFHSLSDNNNNNNNNGSINGGANCAATNGGQSSTNRKLSIATSVVNGGNISNGVGGSNGSNGISSSNIKNENKITLMVVLVGLVKVAGHLPALIYYLPIEMTDVSGCFLALKSTSYYLTFSISIFFYYHFDKNFRKIFQDTFNLNRTTPTNSATAAAVEHPMIINGELQSFLAGASVASAAASSSIANNARFNKQESLLLDERPTITDLDRIQEED